MGIPLHQAVYMGEIIGHLRRLGAWSVSYQTPQATWKSLNVNSFNGKIIEPNHWIFQAMFDDQMGF